MANCHCHRSTRYVTQTNHHLRLPPITCCACFFLQTQSLPWQCRRLEVQYKQGAHRVASIYWQLLWLAAVGSSCLH